MAAIQTAKNDKGETVALVDNAWVPVQSTAANGKGHNAYLINNNWVTDAPDAPDEAAPVTTKMTPSRAAGLTTTGLAPYATAALLGGAVGAPFAGVGFIPGAVAGVGALALTDAATGLYNMYSQYAGKPYTPVGSQALRTGYNQLGIGVAPETPRENMYVDAIDAATGAGMQAKAVRAVAAVLPKGSIARNVAREFSRQPVAQMAGAAGASVATDKAREFGVDNPVLLAAAGFTGGIATGGAVAKASSTVGNIVRDIGKPSVTIDNVKTAAKTKYAEVDASGAAFKPDSYDNFIDNVQRDLAAKEFNPSVHTAVASWVKKLETMRGKGATLSELDSFRSQMKKELGNSSDDNTRRFVHRFTDTIDDYVANATFRDSSSGNLPQARQAISDARRLWTSVSKGEKIDELFRRANLSEGDKSKALRVEFRTLAKSPRQMRQFSPAERKFITQIVEGTPLTRALEELGAAVTSAGKFVAIGGPVAAAAGARSVVPGFDPVTGLAIGAGMLGAGKVLRGVANMLAENQARNMQRYALGQRRPPPLSRNALLSPVVQNTLSNAAMDPRLAAILGYPGPQENNNAMSQ